MLQKAKKETWKRTNRGDEDICYDVREQVGFLLRSAFQRHTAIFMSNIVASLTQTQLAAIATLYYSDPLAHNELGASVGTGCLHHQGRDRSSEEARSRQGVDQRPGPAVTNGDAHGEGATGLQEGCASRSADHQRNAAAIERRGAIHADRVSEAIDVAANERSSSDGTSHIQPGASCIGYVPFAVRSCCGSGQRWTHRAEHVGYKNSNLFSFAHSKRDLTSQDF